MTLLSGPGIGLQLPQNLYVSELNNAPYDVSSNRLGLAPGQSIVVPAGDWIIHTGSYCVLQWKDPVTGVWSMGAAAAWLGSPTFVSSDGFSVRVANLTGCPVSASITNYGSNYVQASTTITAVGSTSTWLPIVGGQLGGVSVTGAGAGYGVAPLVMIPPPPPAQSNANGVGGIPATGYATIASGTVSGFTFTNPGAGYPTAPVAVVVPSPFDPNIATGITAATITFSLVGSGSLTGALCTNNGAPITPANITLTVGGAGTNASLTANVLQTITAASTTGTGTGYGTVTAGLTSVGGAPAAGTITNNPDFTNLAFRPRPAQISLAITAGGTLAAQTGTIVDGGLFQSAPTPVVSINPLSSTGTLAAAAIAFTMGSKNDFVALQPLKV